MIVYLGLVDRREGVRVSESQAGLLSSVIFQLVTQVDNVYAHLITGGPNDPRAPHLYNAFRVGAGAIERLLQAAWGCTVGEDQGGEHVAAEGTSEDTKRLITLAIAAWAAFVIYLDRALDVGRSEVSASDRADTP